MVRLAKSLTTGYLFCNTQTKSCGKDIAAAFFSLLYRTKSAKAVTDFQSAFY